MKIKLKRSNQLVNGEAKQPDIASMEYGELAVNFNSADPCIFVRASDGAGNDEMVRIAGSGTGSVTLVEDGTLAAPNADEYPEGTLWFNSAEEDGNLYVLYDDPAPDAGKKWIQITGAGGSGGGDAGEEAYVQLNGDGTAQVITGTGGLKVEGLVEAGGGVKVTGGTVASVVDGINLSGSGDLQISKDSEIRLKIEDDVNTFTDKLFVSTPGDGTTNTLRGITSQVKLTAGEQDVIHFSSQNNGLINYATSVKAFEADFAGVKPSGDASNPNRGYGFYSNLAISSTAGTELFNFFAGRQAANFFAGSTYIGGSTTRNTRELWESTLTEEQKEQLSAGTLTIPANVSTPGDGSFARQWWYDQQSPEDQALIDSGELEYASHLQAANFVDTFDLGDNTNINLLSNGEISGKNLTLATNGASTTSDISLTGSSVIGYADNLSFAGDKASEVRFRFATGDDHDSTAGTKDTTTVHRIDKEYIIPNAIQFKTDSLDFETGNQITASDVGCGIIRRTANGEQAVQIIENGTANFAVNPNTVVANNKNYTTRGSAFTAAGNVVAYVCNSTSPAGLDGTFTSYSSQPIIEGDGPSDITAFRHFHASINEWDNWQATDVIEEQYGLSVGASLSPNGAEYDNIKKTFGVYSNIPNQGNRENYNFYAAGDAPNFFAGITEHGGGVKVTGGTVSNKGQGFIGAADATNGRGLRIMVGDMTRSGGSVYGLSYYVDGDSINIDSDQFFNLVDVSPSFDLECSVSAYNTLASNISGNVAAWVGYNADLSTNKDNITNGYGFYSNIRNSTSDGRSRFNFYAAGTAPNYFSGEVIISGSPDPDPTSNLCRINKQRFLSQSAASANAGYNAFFRRQTNGIYVGFGYYDEISSGQELVGHISRDGDNIALVGLTGGPLILDQGADARNITETAAISNASAVIQQLNPVRINNQRFGFTAADLQPVVSEAVVGTADETLPIGTLADYDGTVLETEVTEPDASELTYTEDVTDSEGVTTQEVRTRTWTETGTRPVYQGVDQTKLIPLLTKALQEALARIEELESNTLQPLYATLADLPDASDHHGKVAHVHSEGALYFAHAGNWVKLQNA